MAGPIAIMVEVDFFQLTDIGCARADNEDSIGCWACGDGLLFAVADGLGGRAAGQEASALALMILAREMERAPAGWPVPKRLRRAVQEANLEVHLTGMAVPQLRGMASTLTATAIVGGSLFAAHVGDTRLYLLREGRFVQLTKDHTWVADQVGYGLLSPEEARQHPRKNVLTRCLGVSVIVGIDTLTMGMVPGDVLMQCSDGVHGPLETEELAGLLSGGTAEAACRAIAGRVLERGGEDNLSVQVAAVKRWPRSTLNPRWWIGR